MKYNVYLYEHEIKRNPLVWSKEISMETYLKLDLHN